MSAFRLGFGKKVIAFAYAAFYSVVRLGVGQVAQLGEVGEDVVGGRDVLA